MLSDICIFWRAKINRFISWLLFFFASGSAHATLFELNFLVSATSHWQTDSGYTWQSDLSFVPRQFHYKIIVNPKLVFSSSDQNSGTTVATLEFLRFPDSPFSAHLRGLYPSTPIANGLITSSVAGGGINATSRANGERSLSFEDNQEISWQSEIFGRWHYNQMLALWDSGGMPYDTGNAPRSDEDFVVSIMNYFASGVGGSQWSESAGYYQMDRYHIGSVQRITGIQEQYQGYAELISVSRVVSEPNTLYLAILPFLSIFAIRRWRVC